MTLPSRGVSGIQLKGTGDDMKSCGMKKGGKADARKGMLNNTESSKMNVGVAQSKAAMPGYKKGGKIDGCAVKGHTKGRMV